MGRGRVVIEGVREVGREGCMKGHRKGSVSGLLFLDLSGFDSQSLEGERRTTQSGGCEVGKGLRMGVKAGDAAVGKGCGLPKVGTASRGLQSKTLEPGCWGPLWAQALTP